jgi:photosystem II stability/assembly factor-like uncharacterized protein
VPLTDQLPVTGVADAALSKSDPDKLWIATGDAFTAWSRSCGIYFSPDGGITWSPASFQVTPSDSGPVIHRIILDPQNDSSLFAGTSEGLFQSDDAGSTFIKRTGGRIQDIEWAGKDPSALLFTRLDPSGESMICRSPDGGVTIDTVYRSAETVSRIELATAGDIAVALLAGPSGNLLGIFRSLDGGASWEKRAGSSPNIMGWNCEGTDNRGAGTDILSLAVNPWNTDEVYAGSNYLWKSRDGGKSWSAISGWCGGEIPYVRPYHRALAFGPDRMVYTGSGGGIFRSADQGKSWTNVSANLSIMPVTAISASPDTGFLVAGTLENGNMRIRQGTWEFIFDGDGIHPLVHDSLHFIIQAREALSSQIKLLKTINGGYDYKNITPEGKEGDIYSAVVPYPGQDQILYFSYGPLFRSTDGGETWEVIALREAGDAFRILEPSEIRPTLWYAASPEKVWRSEDGGKQWEEILDPAFFTGKAGEITSLKSSPSDPGLVWAGCASGSLIQSNDGGSSWVDISGGLPGGPIYCLAYDPSRQLLFAGTRQGLRARSRNSGWMEYGSGLPHNQITALHIDRGEGTLYAGTLGRGIWKTSLCAIDEWLAIDFKLTSYVTCGGSETTVSATATGPVDSWQWDFGERAVPSSATGAGPHTITFQETGFKTIRLLVNDSIELVRKNLVEAVDGIHVEVLAERICTGDTVNLVAMGADTYEWSPDEGLIREDGLGSAWLFPRGVVSYVVSGTMGLCTATDTVVIETVADGRSSAFPLRPGMNGPFTNACATASPSDPAIPTGTGGTGCNSQDGWCKKRSLTSTVWFSLQVPGSGTLSIEAPAGFNNQVALFRVNPQDDSLKLLAANDDYFGLEGNNAAALTGVTGLEPGETLYLMLDGGGTGETGEFFLVLNDALLGVEDQSPPSVLVYPNPVAGTLWISGIDESCSYQLLSLDGKLLQSGRLLPGSGGSMMQIEIPGLPEQLVLLRLYGDDFHFIQKLMIQEER